MRRLARHAARGGFFIRGPIEGEALEALDTGNLRGLCEELGDVLFERMGIKGGRKGKSGVYSTDVTELERIRKDSQKDYDGQGIKLTMMPFLTKAVAVGLKLHPIVNASVGEDGAEIVVTTPSEYPTGKVAEVYEPVVRATAPGVRPNGDVGVLQAALGRFAELRGPPAEINLPLAID